MAFNHDTDLQTAYDQLKIEYGEYQNTIMELERRVEKAEKRSVKYYNRYHHLMYHHKCDCKENK